MADPNAAAIVHDAIDAYLNEGEIAVAWTLVIDVAGQDGNRYLAHRGGGGVDGHDGPTIWAALGMLESSADLARLQVAQNTRNRPEDDGDA